MLQFRADLHAPWTRDDDGGCSSAGAGIRRSRAARDLERDVGEVATHVKRMDYLESSGSEKPNASFLVVLSL